MSYPAQIVANLLPIVSATRIIIFCNRIFDSNSACFCITRVYIWQAGLQQTIPAIDGEQGRLTVRAKDLPFSNPNIYGSLIAKTEFTAWMCCSRRWAWA
jgi:hypothetical protein